MSDARFLDDIRFFATQAELWPRFTTRAGCEQFLTQRKRRWCIDLARRVVQNYYVKKKSAASGQKRGKEEEVISTLEEALIQSNGQSCQLSDLLLAYRQMHAKGEEEESKDQMTSTWVLNTWIFFSPMLHAAREKRGQELWPVSLQLFSSDTGRNFVVEGSRRVDPSVATTGRAKPLSFWLQIAREKQADEQHALDGLYVISPLEQNRRLATVELLVEETRRFTSNVVAPQYRWHHDTPMSAEGEKSEAQIGQELRLDDWRFIFIIFGDDIHWRLLLLVKYGFGSVPTTLLFDSWDGDTLLDASTGNIRSEKHYEMITDILKGLSAMGYFVVESSLPLIIEGIRPGIQTDGWSCGWQTLIHLESLVELVTADDFIYEADHLEIILSLYPREATHTWKRARIQERLVQCRAMRDELSQVLACTLALLHHCHLEFSRT